MKKSNYTYSEIIDLLQAHTHSAPDRWSEIEDSLDLQNSLDQLPTYKAPDLWDNIESALDEPTPAPPKGNRHLLFLKIASFIIVALLAIIAYLLSGSESSNDGYQYKSEMVMASLVADKVEIDNDLDHVLAFIENNGAAFSAKELEEFQNQLLEINTAIERIIELQNTYGKDASSVKLLARMERDKSELLKSIIVKAS